MTEVLLSWFLCPKVLQRVRPEEVTHRAKRWRLLETIQLKERKRGREGGRERGRREGRREGGREGGREEGGREDKMERE